MTMYGNSPRRCCSLHLKAVFLLYPLSTDKVRFPDARWRSFHNPTEWTSGIYHREKPLGKRHFFPVRRLCTHTPAYRIYRIPDRILSCTGHNGYCPAASSLYKRLPGRNTVFSRPVSSWGMFPYTAPRISGSQWGMFSFQYHKPSGRQPGRIPLWVFVPMNGRTAVSHSLRMRCIFLKDARPRRFPRSWIPPVWCLPFPLSRFCIPVSLPTFPAHVPSWFPESFDWTYGSWCTVCRNFGSPLSESLHSLSGLSGKSPSRSIVHIPGTATGRPGTHLSVRSIWYPWYPHSVSISLPSAGWCGWIFLFPRLFGEVSSISLSV